jgi:hypothetical protein
VSLTDLARATVLRSPEALPEYWDKTIVSGGGAFGERGPAFTTIQEMLALIGADAGVYPVPEQARHYYARPDVAYLPIRDTPPWEWVLVRVAAAETERTRAFTRAARLEAAGNLGARMPARPSDPPAASRSDRDRGSVRGHCGVAPPEHLCGGSRSGRVPSKREVYCRGTFGIGWDSTPRDQSAG